MKTTSMNIIIAVWFLAFVAAGFGEDFPSRPTSVEIGNLVISGTQCAHGVNERCWATQGSAPFVKTDDSGWYLDQDMMGTMAGAIKSVAPYYADPDTVYNHTPNISMYTVPGLFAELNIGDHTSLFTATPAIGTNAAVYGDSPWRIYAASLDERHDVINALHWSVIGLSYTDVSYFGVDYNVEGFDEIAKIWPTVSWQYYPPNFVATWMDTIESGPESIMKMRAKFQFIAPACTSVTCGVQMYLYTEKFLQAGSNEFLDFEAPGAENEYFIYKSFSAPLTPAETYTSPDYIGNSSAIIPYPEYPPDSWTKGWKVSGKGIVCWNFQYCTD